MKNNTNQQAKKEEVSDEELIKVITDFLEMGHVENIVAMFKQETSYYQWVGTLLEDERFAVRLGVSVLFEYLLEDRPDEVHLAIPSLATAIKHETSWVRGEAVSVLAMIGSSEAMVLVKTMVDDPATQVADIARDIIEESE